MSTLDSNGVRWRWRSRSTDNANCVEVAFLGGWRRNSRSMDQANCVEVALAEKAVATRDSKDLDGGALVFTRAR